MQHAARGHAPVSTHASHAHVLGVAALRACRCGHQCVHCGWQRLPQRRVPQGAASPHRVGRCGGQLRDPGIQRPRGQHQGEPRACTLGMAVGVAAAHVAALPSWRELVPAPLPAHSLGRRCVAATRPPAQTARQRPPRLSSPTPQPLPPSCGSRPRWWWAAHAALPRPSMAPSSRVSCPAHAGQCMSLLPPAWQAGAQRQCGGAHPNLWQDSPWHSPL